MAEIGTITTLFLTAAGLRLQAKVQAGRTPLILTRVKIGYGYLQDDMDLKSLTGPINEVPSHQTGEEGTTATVDLTRVYDDTQEGMAYVGICVKNGDNPRFFLREFAIYANDPDVGEICYGIANLGDEAPPISPYDGRNYVRFNYDFPTIIANADDVVANITLAADTPWEDFIDHVQNNDNPHTINFTEAETLANITSGEKMSIMFGKIKKAIASIISHLQEPHAPSNAEPHKPPTSVEITSALGYTPASRSHSHSISDVTELSTELKVTLGDNLELTDATGKASFYHFTLTGWTEGESHVLTSVNTTFGSAKFGASHGLPNCAQGSITEIYVCLYVKNGVVMWDEWYNGYDADYDGDTMFNIGAYTAVYDAGTGNEGFYVNYINDSTGKEVEYTLRKAIVELANRISVLRSTS